MLTLRIMLPFISGNEKLLELGGEVRQEYGLTFSLSFCLFNAMHSIGQSIKSHERPSLRSCVSACERPSNFEASYLHNGER